MNRPGCPGREDEGVKRFFREYTLTFLAQNLLVFFLYSQQFKFLFCKEWMNSNIQHGITMIFSIPTSFKETQKCIFDLHKNALKNIDFF